MRYTKEKLIPGKLYLITEDTEFFEHLKELTINRKVVIKEGDAILYLANDGSKAFESRKTLNKIMFDDRVCLVLYKNVELIIYEKKLQIKTIT